MTTAAAQHIGQMLLHSQAFWVTVLAVPAVVVAVAGGRGRTVLLTVLLSLSFFGWPLAVVIAVVVVIRRVRDRYIRSHHAYAGPLETAVGARHPAVSNVDMHSAPVVTCPLCFSLVPPDRIDPVWHPHTEGSDHDLTS